jgi:D-glycero-alpha-D-manno-heptose-7-phosphate kinase
MTTSVHAQVAVVAPVRLDLAGGWTDVAPFSSQEGGAVTSAAIGLSVRATAHRSERWRLIAHELGADVELAALDRDPADRRVALHLSAVRRLGGASPVTLATESEVPPGSGLGSSGALGVALVEVLATLNGRSMAPDEAAALAFDIETVGAGVPGGKQDQFSAGRGGFNLMTFGESSVQVEPLALDTEFCETLAASTVLCHTGASRLSGNTIARVMAAYEAGDPRVAGALREIRDLALEMREALVSADLARTARLLSRNWAAQQRLDPGMRTDDMARLEAAMTQAGVLGGKAAGSGAGGCMFFLAANPAAAAQRARELGMQLLPVSWARRGVHTT